MTKARTSPAPRNKPKQERSQSTVNAILDGAIRVLEQKGPEALTTTQAAEAAGVSVGTLYQYFRNREDIVDALQEREFARASAMLMTAFSSQSFTSEKETARAIVAGLLALYRKAPALHRLLALAGLQHGPAGRVEAFDLATVTHLSAFLELSPWPIRRDHPKLAAFVLYHTVRAVLLAYLLESPAGIDDSMIVEEVTRLVVAHLAPNDLR